MAVELHCPVQINSSLRHYGRSTDLAELRGREDVRGIKREMQREEEVNGQNSLGKRRWGGARDGGTRRRETRQKVSIREVVPLA